MTIRPDIFSPFEGIVAGFSTRHGGVSAAPYSSLNLGLSTDDPRENVLENRRRLFASVGFSLDRLAITGQVHGVECAHVTAPGLYRGFDAMVTDTPGLLLCLSAADCASVLLADAGAGVIGACHAGWRGAAGGIVGNTVHAMMELGAHPASVCAYISPCISTEHFEVGEEVAAHFDERVIHRASGWPKPHVDLKGAIVLHLLASGLPESAIEVSPECTYAGAETFFSHRAENGKTGRLMGFIGKTE